MPISYSCTTCKYATNAKTHFDNHKKTKKHIANVEIKDSLNNGYYKCTICNFKSTNKSNYESHLKTVKHQSNIKQNINDEDIDLIVSDESLNKRIDSLEKELLVQKTHFMDKLLKEKDNYIEKMETIMVKQLDVKDVQIKEKNNYIEKMETIMVKQLDVKDVQIKEKDKQIDEKDKQAKQSFNLLNHLITNYPNAPNIQKLTDFSFMREPDEDREMLLELIITYYEEDRLLRYLANNILSIYKKTSISDQSLWSSDPSRNSYIVKNKVNDDDSRWMRDVRGELISKFIIAPYMDYLIEELMWYFRELVEGRPYKKRINPVMKSQTTLLQIRNDIKDKKIETKLKDILSEELLFANRK